MANTLTHKKSSTPGVVPTSGQLSLGEIAINAADGNLFIKKTDNSIVTLAASATATVETLQRSDLVAQAGTFLNINYNGLVSNTNAILTRTNL